MMRIKHIYMLTSLLVISIFMPSLVSAAKSNNEQKPALRIMIIGAPGVGKGTQAKLLAEKYHIPQISTGDLLRSEIANGSPLGLKAKQIMASGELLSDDIIFSLLQSRLNKPDCINGYIIDGFPRTVTQAELLKNANIHINYIIEIKADDNDIVARISGRRIHQPSGRVYHIVYNPPKKPGIDDLTGQPLVQRQDDKEATVRNRLAIYHNQTEPLINYYHQWSKSKKTDTPKIYSFSGNASINEIFNHIVNKLNTNR